MGVLDLVQLPLEALELRLSLSSSVKDWTKGSNIGQGRARPSNFQTQSPLPAPTHLLQLRLQGPDRLILLQVLKHEVVQLGLGE